MTVAMSLLVHGEAVRFNRGQSRDDFDFKYMKGRDGREYPYVSSQCFKKYWREALPDRLSPITRAKGAGGKEKNQAYTSGNPIDYLDDDLFGYMIAGAAEDEESTVDTDGADLPEAAETRLFDEENIKDAEKLRMKFLETTPLSQFILNQFSGRKGGSRRLDCFHLRHSGDATKCPRQRRKKQPISKSRWNQGGSEAEKSNRCERNPSTKQRAPDEDVLKRASG
jgi:hypothetical protein